VNARGRWLLPVAALTLVTLGCGKRGDPLPPLRPVPARIEDLAAMRLPDRVELHWTIPAANMDGTTPPAVDRVDLFAVTLPSESPAPGAEAIVDGRQLIARMIVRRDAQGPPAAGAPPDTRPVPGERATFVDRAPVEGADGPQTRHYVAIAAAGASGNGRPGPPSPVVSVPLGALPSPPAGVTLTHDETNIRLSWEPAEASQVYRVYRTAAVPTEPPALVTSEPLAATELAVPVAFGRESCFSVQPLRMLDQVTIVGAASPPQCITPTDSYPPPVPTGLQVVQEGSAVTLIWTPVTAADLAGYIVLRGDATGQTLQPLVQAPVQATTFRDENVQTGVGYAYAVYAVDNSPAQNASAPSARQTITVR
jgi:hypothetical protein